MTPAEIIIQKVAADYGVSPDVLTSRQRHEPVATARLLAVALTRDLTTEPDWFVGASFKRDGGVVRYAVHANADRIATEKGYAARYNRLRIGGKS